MYVSYSGRLGPVIPIRWGRGFVALERRQVGVAVGPLDFTCSASLQPGTGSGVGGKGRWTAFAVPPQTEPAGGRGKIATVSSGGAGKIVTQAAERAHRKREPFGRQSREHCTYDAW